jgi:hypothetical protein
VTFLAPKDRRIPQNASRNSSPTPAAPTPAALLSSVRATGSPHATRAVAGSLRKNALELGAMGWGEDGVDVRAVEDPEISSI